MKYKVGDYVYWKKNDGEYRFKITDIIANEYLISYYGQHNTNERLSINYIDNDEHDYDKEKMWQKEIQEILNETNT